MQTNYNAKVEYNATYEWYEVELNNRIVYVRGDVDETDAFAFAAMYFSNFDLECVFDGEVNVDYVNNVITYIT